MSKEKKKIKLEKDGNLLKIGNKWYMFSVNEDGNFRTGTHTLVEVDKKKRDKQIKTITKRLFSFVDPKLVMSDALKDLTEEELAKLHNFLLKHKGKMKPKVKKHCVLLEVGGVEIPIR